MDDVHDRVAALEGELAELKAQLAAAAPAEPTSRRDMFKKLAIAGAGVAAGSVLVQATPASATTQGQPLVNGVPNTAIGPTSIAAGAPWSGGHVFLANETGFAPDTTSVPGALAAWSNTRTGLFAWTNSGPQGVAAVGQSPTSYGLRAAGGRANVMMTPSGIAPPFRADAHFRGELLEDMWGDLWLCVEPGSPGSWRKLAGPLTAGSLHLLSTPERVYDSRPGEPPQVGMKAPLVANTPRPVDAGANSSGVPGGANGVLVTLTVTGAAGAGFLSAWPSGTWPGTSSLNFAAGQTIATTTVVGCASAATFQVLVNQSAHLIVDVIGYYR